MFRYKKNSLDYFGIAMERFGYLKNNKIKVPKRNEKDYLTHLNYLFNNPIKHQYVENLKDYPYSSFHQFLGKQGREKLVYQFKDNSDYKKLYLVHDR